MKSAESTKDDESGAKVQNLRRLALQGFEGKLFSDLEC
jgi:hypothetical protein